MSTYLLIRMPVTIKPGWYRSKGLFDPVMIIKGVIRTIL